MTIYFGLISLICISIYRYNHFCIAFLAYSHWSIVIPANAIAFCQSLQRYNIVTHVQKSVSAHVHSVFQIFLVGNYSGHI